MTDDPRKTVTRTNRSIDSFQFERMVRQQMGLLRKQMGGMGMLNPKTLGERIVRMPDGTIIRVTAIAPAGNEILVPQYKVSVVPPGQVVSLEKPEEVINVGYAPVLYFVFVRIPYAAGDDGFIVDSTGERIHRSFFYNLETISPEGPVLDISDPSYSFDTGLHLVAQHGAKDIEENYLTLGNFYVISEELGEVNWRENSDGINPDENHMWGDISVVTWGLATEQDRVHGSDKAQISPESSIQDSDQARENYILDPYSLNFKIIGTKVGTATMTGTPDAYSLLSQRYLKTFKLSSTLGESAILWEDEYASSTDWKYYVPIVALNNEEAFLRDASRDGDTWEENIKVGSTTLHTTSITRETENTIENEVMSVSVSGSTDIEVPSVGSSTYGYSASGCSGWITPTYGLQAIVGPLTGLSIDANGTLTVLPTVTACRFYVTASCCGEIARTSVRTDLGTWKCIKRTKHNCSPASGTLCNYGTVYPLYAEVYDENSFYRYLCSYGGLANYCVSDAMGNPCGLSCDPPCSELGRYPITPCALLDPSAPDCANECPSYCWSYNGGVVACEAFTGCSCSGMGSVGPNCCGLIECMTQKYTCP